MREFNFSYPNISTSLKNFFQPSQNLLNIESGIEEASTVPTQYLFYPNESYFSYDKSNLAKESYITAINKKVSLYGYTSYFNNKIENEMLKIISPENLLKFLVNRDTIRNNLSFQLTSISGTVPTLKDKKIHNLSLTRLGRKTKLPMHEPIETVIIRAQQSFEVAGGMNPVQTELKDNGVLNLLKKHKNVAYNLTLLGILFPASLRNNTRQIFITCKELNDFKKSLINGKVYGLLGIIDLEKINNWEEI